MQIFGQWRMSAFTMCHQATPRATRPFLIVQPRVKRCLETYPLIDKEEPCLPNYRTVTPTLPEYYSEEILLGTYNALGFAYPFCSY